MIRCCHGPFLFYSNALVYRLFGDTDFNARLLPAVYGCLLIVLGLAFRPFIGRWGSLGLGVLLAISPSFVYYSRFLRNDIYIATYGAGILLSLLYYQKTRHYYYWYLVALMACLAFCTKENTYFLVFSFVSFGVAWWFYRYWRKQTSWTTTYDWYKTHWKALLTCLFLFWIIYLTAYTVFFRYPGDWNGFATGLKYWYAQHQIQRISGSWWYYLPLMGLYEFLPLVFSLIALVYLLKSRISEPLPWFLIYWFTSSLALYSFAGEKVPWLSLHIILPLIILSGWMIQKLYDRRQYLVGILLIPLFVQTGHATYMANFQYFCLDPMADENYQHAETLAFVQTTPDIYRLLIRINQENANYPDWEKDRILITGESAWPLNWYFRNKTSVRYADGIDFTTGTYTFIITDGIDYESDAEFLSSRYDPVVYHLRAWWPRPVPSNRNGLLQSTGQLYQKQGAKNILRYFLHRQTSEPGGSHRIVLWIKKPS